MYVCQDYRGGTLHSFSHLKYYFLFKDKTARGERPVKSSCHSELESTKVSNDRSWVGPEIGGKWLGCQIPNSIYHANVTRCRRVASKSKILSAIAKKGQNKTQCIHKVHAPCVSRDELKWQMANQTVLSQLSYKP
jgi:hypothetical protein